MCSNQVNKASFAQDISETDFATESLLRGQHYPKISPFDCRIEPQGVRVPGPRD